MLGPLWKILRRGIGLEDPFSLLNQVYSDCTQREAAVDHRHVQNNYHSSSDGRDITRKQALLDRPITAWRYDMERHAEKCADRFCGACWKKRIGIKADGNAVHG